MSQEISIYGTLKMKMGWGGIRLAGAIAKG